MCVRKFAEPVQLQIHMTRHKTIKCNVCPFETTKKADLKKHAKTHETIDLEPQSCPKCGRNFSIKEMEKHMKTHTKKSNMNIPCWENRIIIRIVSLSQP